MLRMSELFKGERVDGGSTARLRSPVMATPPSDTGTKTIRVRTETHKRLMDLAERLDGSADDALGHLLGSSTIRVPVSDIQRDRWSEAAHAAGVSVPEFVKMRVEAALQWGGDPGVLGTIYDQLIRVCQHTGMRRRPVNQSTQTSVVRPSAIHTPSTERQS